jgi:stage III sporulation protein AD
MERMVLSAALVLMAAILNQVLSRQGKDFSVLLSLAACCLVAVVVMEYLQPVLDFIKQLQVMVNLDHTVLSILLRAVGIGIITELTQLLCADAGEHTLAKVLQLTGAAAILYLSLPLLSAYLELMEKILGNI